MSLDLPLADEDGSVNVVEMLQVDNVSHSSWLHHNGSLLFEDLCSKPDNYQTKHFGN